MMRRPLVLVALSLLSLTLAACSDVTAPTGSERQIGAGTSAGARTCSGGYSTSTGKC